MKRAQEQGGGGTLRRAEGPERGKDRKIKKDECIVLVEGI